MAALFLAQLTALAAPSGKANPRVVIASEAGAKIASWTNYRSVSSITTARDSRSNVTNLSLEGTFGRNLSALLSYSYEHDRYFLESNGTNALLSPNDSRAVNRQWSYTVDPNGASLIRWYLETLRVNMIYHHTIGDFLKGDLVLGFENRFKYQMINRQRLYAVNASGAPGFHQGCGGRRHRLTPGHGRVFGGLLP